MRTAILVLLFTACSCFGQGFNLHDPAFIGQQYKAPAGGGGTCTLAISNWAAGSNLRSVGDADGRYYGGTSNITFSTSTQICRVDFQLTKGSTATITTNTYNVVIATNNATSANVSSPVGVSTGVTGNDSWSTTWVQFNFSTPVTLNPGTNYCFLVKSDKASLVSYARWTYATSDTMQGAFASYNSAGAAQAVVTGDPFIVIWTQQ